MIPAADFCGMKISRLILGDNPVNGHSYITKVHSGKEMMDYYTSERVLKLLFDAEEYGITTYLALADQFILRILRQYRNEGGKMNIIFQSYPPVDFGVNLWQMMECNPVGIYHQGGTFDLFLEEENLEEVHRRLAAIKSAGVKVGICSHVPEVLIRAEEEDWGADFYLGCLYNARRTQRGQQSGFITGNSKELEFYPGDPVFMYEAVRKVSKPCIVFKLFAGGQVFLSSEPEEIPALAEAVYTEVFKNIKDTDIACVGVFQKVTNQLKENVDIVKKVLSH